MPRLMGVPFAPFPASEQTVELDRLSLAKIRNKDAVETNSLYSSCKRLGFFLLDMNDSQEGKVILGDVAALFELSTQIFDLDLEEKQKYAMLNGTVYG
jgi:isopenicillin N synthase-like dioxygenase